jgi:hypothetical protein
MRRVAAFSLSGRRYIVRRHGGIAVCLAALLALSACATAGGGEPLTPAQAQLQQANQRFVTTTVEGTVGGALLGAGIGYLTGGARGALIGAGAGAVAGTAVGYAVAQNNLSQSHSEANLQNLIQQANADADAYERSATASAQIAADLRSQIAQLDGQYAANTITASQYRAKIASYHTSADLMRKQLADMAQESGTLRSDSASYGGAHGAALNNAADRIARARQSEAASLNDLDTALAAVPAST